MSLLTPALARVAELAFEGGREACEPILEDVVVRSRAHHVDRELLADRAGDDDEREVEVALLRGPRAQLGRAEPRHRPVAGDDVPDLPVVERRAQLASSESPSAGDSTSMARAAERSHRQLAASAGESSIRRSRTLATRSLPDPCLHSLTDIGLEPWFMCPFRREVGLRGYSGCRIRRSRSPERSAPFTPGGI
jgi:hypothetical protein